MRKAIMWLTFIALFAAVMAVTVAVADEAPDPVETAIADKVAVIVTEDGGVRTFSMEYVYNPDGSVASTIKSEPQDGGLTWAPTNRTLNTYGPGGEILSGVQEISADAGVTWTESSTNIYSYDANGNRIISDTTQTGNGMVSHIVRTMSYNEAGQQIGVEINIELQLFGTTMESRYEYEYDTAGNRIREIQYLKQNGEWVNSTVANIEYDELGNMLSQYSYDVGSDGSLFVNNRGIRIYDAAGRLTEMLIERPVGDGWAPYIRTRFEYTADGQRSRTESADYVDGEWVTYNWYEYAWDNDVLVSIARGNGDGTVSRDMYYYDKSTGVAEIAVPSAVAISGNAPNPFNPSTTIAFTLDTAARADLTIYNMAGQAIRTLISHDMSPGEHSAVWDGRNDSGMTVSAGVYFVRLVAGTQTATHKMLFVK